LENLKRIDQKQRFWKKGLSFFGFLGVIFGPGGDKNHPQKPKKTSKIDSSRELGVKNSDFGGWVGG
jgi:hypothetical protein